MRSDKIDTVKKDLLKALESSMGIVSSACKKVNISRETYYKYYNNDPDFKIAVDSLSENQLDFAESKLLKLINDENPAAIFFYLKCKGKKRGYTEKTIEIELKQPVLSADQIEFYKKVNENVEKLLHNDNTKE